MPVRCGAHLRVAGGGLHSPLERLFSDLIVGARLPRPSSQVVIRRSDGKVARVARVDVTFPDHRLIVEVSGHRTHSRRADRQADAQRHRQLELTGMRWIEFTSDEVFFRPAQCMAELAAHLGLA